MTTPWAHPKTGGLLVPQGDTRPARATCSEASGEVRRSLRTKDRAEARVRYAEIAHEVEATIAAASAPPRAATHEQLCALAGEWYRRKRDECGPEPRPRREWGSLAQDFHEDVKALIARDRRDRGAASGGPLDDEALDRALFDDDGPPIAWSSLAADLPDALGTVAAEVDAIATGHGLNLDAASRDQLHGFAFRAFLMLCGRMELRAGGDYSPDPNLAAFPALPAATDAPAPTPRETVPAPR